MQHFNVFKAESTVKLSRIPIPRQRFEIHIWPSVKVQIAVFVVKVLTGSPSIIGAVVRRCWLQFHIWFISLLAAYSSLQAAAVLCLMPCLASWTLIMLTLLILWSGSSDSHSLYTILGPCSPLYNGFCYTCWDSFLHFACQDSMSSFMLACWDSMSGFPGLWLATSDWCLSKDVYCKPGCVWWLFIICTMMGS